MDKVFTLQQALEWFLEHSEGRLLCVDEASGREQECSTYPDAKDFYAKVAA